MFYPHTHPYDSIYPSSATRVPVPLPCGRVAVWGVGSLQTLPHPRPTPYPLTYPHTLAETAILPSLTPLLPPTPPGQSLDSQGIINRRLMVHTWIQTLCNMLHGKRSGDILTCGLQVQKIVSSQPSSGVSCPRPTRCRCLSIAAFSRLPRASAGVGFTAAKDLACSSVSLPLLLWRGRACGRGASCTT